MTPRRLLAAVLVLVVVALGTGADAAAHEGDPAVRPVLERVEPALPGVTIQVHASVTAQLVVENSTDAVLEVLDDDGQPFLRIGPDGVEADLASAAFAASNQPFGGLPAATAPVEPRWALIAVEPSWGWFEHRLHATGAVEGDDWTVPMRYDGRPVEVVGRLERTVVRGTVQPALAGGAAVATPFPDVAVQLVPGIVPGLFLRNTGTSTVVVLGAHGEPFLRIGPGGAEANVRSPSWAASLQGQGHEPPVADAAAEPVWELVSEQPVMAWLETRGLYRGLEPPEDVLDAEEPVVLVEWSVPMEIDGARAEVAGETRWIPLAGAASADDHDDGWPLGVRLALAGVAAGGAGWAVGTVWGRRRRALSRQ